MTTPLNIVFAGTPDFAARHLAALLGSQHKLLAVYTQPDRPAGRGKKLTPSAVKQLALEHDLLVYQPVNFKLDEDIQALAALKPDLMVVVAYGLLLPKAVLEIPRHGCINVHGSLLPKWRGAAPIQRAIWAGDGETGVTIMQMDEGLDTGAMLSKTRCPIEDQDTSASLYQKLAEQGPEAMLQSIDKIATGTAQATSQDDSQATYAAKLTKTEARIDWRKPATALWREVRAFYPWPCSYFEADGKAIKVLQTRVESNRDGSSPGTIINADKQGITIATGEGSLVIETLQVPGKKAMAAGDIINGQPAWLTSGEPLPLADRSSD